ncbi:MAG: hypothetical protein L6Q98_13110 [Anaerolineae bacterium]|nr:hypothetical protein [Anaerolineae bacterium]NUQ03269.1 hypothetical protein [Anaerolineae bacterium]
MRLPSNAELTAFSQDVAWDEVERMHRGFNRALETLRSENHPDDRLPLDRFSDAVGNPVVALYGTEDLSLGNVLMTPINGRNIVLGSTVSKRYRTGYDFLHSLVPYNLNPSVNHTNVGTTEDSSTRLRVLGAELELGLVHEDGRSPSEAEVRGFMQAYYNHALRIGVYPHLDREACTYQVEAHVAPSVGYHKTRMALNGMMGALIASCRDTGLRTLIFSSYPTESDFKMTDHPKVDTAVDLMLQVNGMFPEYARKLAEAQARYHVDPATSHYVNMFRNQGCHIHIDIAGRSEALGLLTFYTVLKSATAVANAAFLKGCPFINGTCDPELLCTREYVRGTTVTGRYLDLPLSPHLMEGGLENYGELLRLERANSTGRANMYNDDLNEKISVMHNPIGRLRPDLSTSKRVCTVESTGMPTNISPSRMAAVLIDFEFSHVVIELYFRKHGCDLEPMHDDPVMWDLFGPISLESFKAQQDRSDLVGVEASVHLNSGRDMSLADFYEMKRRYMHKALDEIEEIMPRDIDEVYSSFIRMLEPPSGHSAQTIEEFIKDTKLRSTGNWGEILKNAYIEAGGVVGDHCPDAVLKVVNRVHDALIDRYLGG